MVSKEKKPVSLRENTNNSELAHRFKANPLVFIGTIIVLVIVIVAFVFVPAIVPSAGGLRGELSFGSYDKIPITYVPGNYFAQMREAIAQYQQSSVNDSNYQMVNYQIWRQAFEEAVIHTAILDEMKKVGYTAPEETVDRRVAELPQFWENGVFSSAKYRQLDNTSRMSLWRQIQESIADEYYRADITELKVSAKEASFMSNMAAVQRTFDMAVFSLRDYPDTEISAYAAANADLFRVIHLSRITINSSEREARQILNSIQEGTTTFEEAARTHSQDGYADRGGDMGIKMAYELMFEAPDEARESLVKLVKGELSALVKVDSGWAFFRAEEAPYPPNTGDATLLEKIRVYIMEYERGRVEDFYIRQAEALIADIKESGFDEALLQKGMDKRNFGPLPINYGGTPLFTALTSFSVPELSSAQSDANFWQTAFATPLQTPSNPLVVGGSVVIVLYPLEETAMDETNVSYTETAYSSYWLPSYINQNIRSYFLNSEKFEDRFFDIYFKYIQP
jgi:hypothetical protein